MRSEDTSGRGAYWEKDRGVWHLDCDASVTGKEFRREGRWYFERADSGASRSVVRRHDASKGLGQSSRVLSRRVIVLMAVLVVSTLVLGYSLGRDWWYRPPTPTSEIPSPPKWISSDANVVSYLDANRYVGQTKTVEGEIVRTYRYEPGNVIFLNFHDPYQGYFTVIIWRENWKNFPFAPEVFYKGKEVRVTGLIYDYKGTPQIEVTSPKQIEVAYMGFDYLTAITVAVGTQEVRVLLVFIGVSVSATYCGTMLPRCFLYSRINNTKDKSMMTAATADTYIM